MIIVEDIEEEYEKYWFGISGGYAEDEKAKKGARNKGSMIPNFTKSNEAPP